MNNSPRTKPGEGSLLASPTLDGEILDACCGGRMWWWDKAHPLAVYMDKRIAGPGSHSTRANWRCEPGILGDFRAMPFDDEAFRLVVFDPPHLTRRDPVRAEHPTGNMLVCYGVLSADTEQDDLLRGFAECWRVLAPGGTLVFKWAGPLDRVQPHFPAPPIVSTKTLRKGSGLGTRWFIFYKPLPAKPVPSSIHGEGRAGRVTDEMPTTPGEESHPDRVYILIDVDNPERVHPEVMRDDIADAMEERSFGGFSIKVVEAPDGE